MSTFGRQMRKIRRQLKSTLEDINRHIILKVGSEIIEGSPVQTGAFVNNWYVFDSDNQPVSYDWTRQGTRELAISRFKSEIYKVDLTNSTIYLKNPTPYHYVAIDIIQVKALVKDASRDFKSYIKRELERGFESAIKSEDRR